MGQYPYWLLERGEDETSKTLLTLNNQLWVRETNAYNHWPFCGESIFFLVQKFEGKSIIREDIVSLVGCIAIVA